MGITVHYRGSIADLDRIEDFEDRVIDLALALGGDCRVWRSADVTDPNRLVRGVILDLAPGQDPTSLLISPEGWLVSLFEIEAAEKGELTEKPWCFVKTQFGPVEGHVALVELLRALKAEFMPDLEVHDEGEYWERQDVGLLQQKMAFLGRAINALGAALERDRLSPEAAEDPEIVATRIQRIASVVFQTLRRPSEHAPTQFPESDEPWQIDAGENEAQWDDLYRENRRKQERILRIVEERMAQGADAEEAHRAAVEEVIGFVPHEEREVDETDFSAEDAWGDSEDSEFEDDFLAEDPAERHPLPERATDYLKELFKIARNESHRSATMDSLIRGGCEVSGGLVQALSDIDEWSSDPDAVGLSLVQLKRALRGGAFVSGSLVQLAYDKTLCESDYERLKEENDAIQTEIVGLLKELRGKG